MWPQPGFRPGSTPLLLNMWLRTSPVDGLEAPPWVRTSQEVPLFKNMPPPTHTLIFPSLVSVRHTAQPLTGFQLFRHRFFFLDLNEPVATFPFPCCSDKLWASHNQTDSTWGWKRKLKAPFTGLSLWCVITWVEHHPDQLQESVGNFKWVISKNPRGHSQK